VIIEDFPASHDQICLIFAQYLSGVVAVEGQSYRHGHDIGAASHLFQRRRLIAGFNVRARRSPAIPRRIAPELCKNLPPLRAWGMPGARNIFLVRA
jgi:hypothetical protein